MWLGLIVGSLVLWLVAGAVRANQREKAFLAAMAAAGLRVTQHVVGIDQKTGVGIDEVSGKMCLITADGKNLPTRLFPYDDLFSAELIEDGVSLMMASRGRFPHPGENGRWVNSAASSARVLELRLVVSRTTAPPLSLTFLNVQTPKNSRQYTDKAASARRWFSLMNVIIDQANRNEEERMARRAALETPAAPPVPLGAVADEIKKLGELMSSGLLTEEEFAEQKAKLLGDTDYEARAAARRLSFGNRTGRPS
ncbi:hypothetical protein CR152_25755 [Massilia violaceinigra]|uniref:SHOCT domain-containing protein n=1 Tax=Massilia violaceinigra TaxID=2045208 RepID=A0A2D2DRC4_9BURK|nr:hypothetical protein CR152_25755 [Massilia violaceinigra]